MASRDEIRTVLAAVLEEECESGPVEIDDGMTALDVPGWDSLAHVRIVMNLENRLSVEIDMDETYRAETIGDLIALVEKSGA